MPVGSSALVILGASGDLSKRKLIPALAELFRKGEIDPSCTVIGSGRTDFSHEEFRNRFAVPGDFKAILHYHRGIGGLSRFIKGIGPFRDIIVFMALPPQAYAPTAAELHAEGFAEGTRIIIEKPFGYDLASARALDEALSRYYSEDQIFRIDHYLAKEAVQNLLVFRFANSLFEPLWNSRYIESIQINAFETLGLESRAEYFDKAGILRDMVQNHLMQLLCLTLMEPPVSLSPEDIRSAKLDVLKNLSLASCLRGQYKGYREEPGVAENSNTETYAELTGFVHNFRWTGMPIHIRTGKAMGRSGTEIGIRFKPLPEILYNERGTSLRTVSFSRSSRLRASL
jgi:glucose-6-phosphate 1-dehydrogenase